MGGNGRGMSIAHRVQVGVAASFAASEAFAGQGPGISEIARCYGTSRNFVYSRKADVEEALEEAFSQAQERGRSIAVTDEWVKAVIVSSALDCHGSVRGIQAHLESIAGVHVSEGKI